MGFWHRWNAERDLRRRAATFLRVIETEPSPEDVRWLAATATAGDLDHATWELRYARRALGLLIAERDALNDRTASAVAKQLASGLARDRNIEAGKGEIARRQFNARLRLYGEALAKREAGQATAARLGRALLSIAGAADATTEGAVARAGELLSGYVEGANEALRAAFGTASLPENVAPSARVAGGPR